MNLNKYNPFPWQAWCFFVFFFIVGYFVGGVVQNIAIRNNQEDTVRFLCNYPKH